MANIFQKLGSAFGQYGMDNRMPTDQFLNLAKGDRRKMQVEGLQKFGEAMNLIGAQQSGNPQRVVQAQNTIRQRQLDEEDAKRKAEQKALFDYQYSLLNEDQKRMVDQQRAGIEIPNNKLPTDQQNYNLAVEQGYKGTFMDYMKDKKAPLVNIDQGQDDFEKSAAEAGFKRLEKAGEVVEGSSDIDSRLVVLEKQVNNLDPVKTGALEELKIPFKKVAAALNILPQDQLDQLTQQELFQSFSGYIIPRMRVVGSGATSDREIELFKLAVPNIGNTIEGNKLLIGGLRSITQYNKNRLKLMEDYLKENKNLLGFGQYADNNLGPIYKTFTNEGEYVNQVKNGTLKEGDFVFDAVNNQFIILNKDDIAAANQ